MSGDAIDKAIDAAVIAEAESLDPEGRAPNMELVSGVINATGRPFVIAIPLDLTDRELMELAAFLLTGHARTLRERRLPSIIPARTLPPT